MLRPVALAKWLLIRAINDGRRTIVGGVAGAIGCAPAPSPVLSAAARRTPVTAGTPGKTLFSALSRFCAIFDRRGAENRG